MNTNSFKSRTLGIVLSIALILSMVMVALPATPVHAAATYYVDGALGADDGTHGTSSGAGAFKTIQYAISDGRVVATDTIIVAAGTYSEDILVNKSINLRGAEYNIDPTATVTTWVGSTIIVAGGLSGAGKPDYAGYSPHLKASNIDFRGFKVMSDGTPRAGLYVGGDGVGTFSNITIAYCELTGRSEAGVILGAMGGTVLSNMVIDHVYSHTNLTGNGIKTMNVGNPTISNCKITSNGTGGAGNSQYGIWIGATNDAVVIPSTITGNTFSGNMAGAIILNEASGSNQDTTGTVISNNTFNDGNTKFGINNAIVAPHEVNGEYNLWSATGGTPAGAQYSADVDYTPWLENNVTVTNPFLNECVAGSSTYQVTWTSYSVPGASAAVQVYNGTSWGTSTIRSGLAQGVNTLQIIMPVANSSACKVKVTISGGGGLTYYDESDTFRIDSTSPTVVLGAMTNALGAPVTCVKGGDSVNLNFNVDDTGSTSLGYVIQYSLDGTTGWTNILPTASFAEVTGLKAKSWTVPSGNTQLCKWKVTATDCAGNTNTDSPSGAFTIDSLAPTPVTLVQPNGGGTPLTAGGTYSIQWIAVDNLPGNLNYTLKYDTASGTGGYTNLIAGPLSRAQLTNSYDWPVPYVNSTTYRIQVTAADCATNQTIAASSADFAIQSTAVPTVTLTAPNGGQTWRAGSTQTISWTATDLVTTSTMKYDVWYCTDYSGTSGTWIPIVGVGLSTAGQTQGAKTFIWTVPPPLSGVTSSQCRVKIIATNQALIPSLPVISASNFTISVDTTSAVTVTLSSPTATNISWQGGTAQTISWTAGSSVSTDTLDVKLYYSSDGSDPSTLITTLNGREQGADCFCWAVPISAPTATYKVKVVAAVTGSPSLTASATSTNAFAVTAVNPDWGITTGTIAGLKTGWNLISLPLIPTACPSTASGLTTSCSCTYPIEGVLASILDKVDRVWYYNNNGTTATWIGYKPGSPSALTRMEDGKAYWLYVTGNCDLTFQGRKSASVLVFPPTYTTVAGWNMVGYKDTLSARTIQQYLGLPCPSTVYTLPIYGQLTFGTAGWSPLLDTCTSTLTTGHGYWVYYNLASTFRPLE